MYSEFLSSLWLPHFITHRKTKYFNNDNLNEIEDFTNIHEFYVNLKTAKLLKKAGFDWECRKCYNGEVMFDMEPDEIRKQCPQYSKQDIPAPTLAVAQRWLREVKNMSAEVLFEKPGKWSCSVILDTNKGLSFENFWSEEFDYDIYEEAKEAGIKKALEIILEKGE